MKVKEKLIRRLVLLLHLIILLMGGLAVNAAEGGNNNSVSGNTIIPSGPSDKSGTSNQEPSEPAVVEAPKNTVSFTTGTTVTSTVQGVYDVNAVNGAAITTTSDEFRDAMDIADTDTNVNAYFCDSSNKTMNELLKTAAGEQEKTVAAFFNADMYSITEQGKVTSITESSTPVRMVFGIPKRLRGNTFTIICLDKNGNVVEFEDVDTDPATISIDANVFGIYSLVY